MASVNAFLEKLKSDKEFAKKIAKRNDTSERIVLIKQHGFDFISATRSAEQGIELRNDGMCFFQKDLKCLRDIVYVACYCPIKKSKQQ